MKKAILTLTVLLLSINLIPCTSFFINGKDQKLFGFNYDWDEGSGYVIINQPNMTKKAFLLDKSKVLSWVSKYGSLTFNQGGAELPHCGLNQAGLAISSLTNNAMKYPEPDNRYGLNGFQWIQYLLDNCKTLNEVEKTISTIQIINLGVPVHYLIADAAGDVAVVEFVDGILKFYKNEELPFSVIGNSYYTEMLRTYYDSTRDTAEVQDRFVNAMVALNDFDRNDSINDYIDYSFSILDRFQHPYTKWQIVFDLNNLNIYFNTCEPTFLRLENDSIFVPTTKRRNSFVGAPTDSERTRVSLDSLKFNCSDDIMFFDIKNHNRNYIYSEFKPYKDNINKKKFKKLLLMAKRQWFIKEMSIPKMVNKYVNHFKDYTCKP